MARSFPHRTVFVDTNILLHYVMFDEIDWPRLTEAKEVLLIIPPAVIRNLDLKKTAANQRRLRERANAVIRKLVGYETQGPESEIRPHTRLEFLRTDPQIDFAANSLRIEVDDDWLLASLLEFRGTHPDVDPVLATADLGLKLKARHRGFEIASLPDDLRLADELDPNEKRIRELELDKAALQAALPSLRLTFGDGSVHQQTQLPASPSPGFDIAAEMDRVVQQHPKTDAAASANAAKHHHGGLRLSPNSDDFKLAQAVEASPEWFALLANTGLDAFYQAYRTYLDQKATFDVMRARTTSLQLVLHNDGTAVGGDVDVYIQFPGQIGLSPAPPVEPVAPQPPWNPFQQAWPGSPFIAAASGSGWPVGMQPAPGPRPIRGPFVEAGDPQRARFQVDRLKHGFEVQLPALFVSLPLSCAQYRQSLPYMVYCGTSPRRESGVLQLVIDSV